MPKPADLHKTFHQFRGRLIGISWRDLAVSIGPVALACVVVAAAAIWLANPGPPSSLTITSGPDGSSFRNNADKYAKILARNGVKLNILSSPGSLENLKRLNDPKFRVDIGLVQGGVTGGVPQDNLVSLGSLFHVPLMVFYRSQLKLERLSDLRGKQLAVGPEGSGTRALALTLLTANGIDKGDDAASVSDLAGADAAQALLDGKLDAVFLMGDSLTPGIIRKLLAAPQVRLLNFQQADAYARRYPYLNKLELPMGSFDVGKNLPPEDLALIGPTVELVARKDLSPALSDLLIEAAREVHGRASLLSKAGEFPAPLEHEFRISDDATRYYASGKGFLYRNLPFWLASLADRVLVVIVPLVVLLVPGMRLVPWLYSWRIRSRIYRWYGALIALERENLAGLAPAERDQAIKRLDDIEQAINRMKVPLAFADQFYVLRVHVGFVRDHVLQAGQAAAQAPSAATPEAAA